MSNFACFPHHQGNILFISIAMLAALSILGLSSMRIALTQEKISQSVQDLHIATEAAESALRHAQRQLKTGQLKRSEDGFSKTHPPGSTAPDLDDWETGIYQMQISDMSVDQTSKALDSDLKVAAWMPKYRVEEFSVASGELDIGASLSAQEKEARSNTYFRIIARGLGLDGKNAVLLESIVIEQTH